MVFMQFHYIILLLLLLMAGPWGHVPKTQLVNGSSVLIKDQVKSNLLLLQILQHTSAKATVQASQTSPSFAVLHKT